MVPKESGFNQSVAASGMCARKSWRFLCSPTVTRDGEVIQRYHFCHHGYTICHPKSGYVTTKLHGTSTCGCNNNAIFSDRAIFTFPAVVICQPRYAAPSFTVTAFSTTEGCVNSLRCIWLIYAEFGERSHHRGTCSTILRTDYIIFMYAEFWVFSRTCFYMLPSLSYNV